MTISSDTSRAGPYNCNGVTIVFGYGFQISDERYIQVIRALANGTQQTLVLGSDYTVAGVGNPSGGSISTLVTYPTGDKITLLRDVPFTQGLDLENQGAYNAEDIEAALDLLTVRDQQIEEKLNRAVVVPPDGDTQDVEDLADNLATLAPYADEVGVLGSITAQIVTVAGISADVSACAAVAPSIPTAGPSAAAAAASAAAAVGVKPRGAWVTATAYLMNDIVNDIGSSYICKVAHTSGASTRPGTGGSWATVWDILAQAGAAGAGSGTVTSVAMTVPTGLAVANSPVTASGTLALTWNGTIPVAQGSTGLSTYVIGDLLQASGAAALSRLAAVATGSVLISGGVGAASAWGKVGLSTHINGTLAAANGGTNITTYTTGDILYASGLNTLAKLPIGTPGNVLTVSGGSVPAWTAGSGMRAPDLWIRDEKAAASSGGTFTVGADRTRTLNVMKANTISASLAANQFTLPAGSYYIQWDAPAYNVLENQSFLYNVTDAAVIERGSTERASNNTTTHSRGEAIVVIAAPKVFEIRHRGSSTSADGFGRPAGFGTEVYTNVRAWKTA